MLGDFFLTVDEVEPGIHRERVAALVSCGYEAVASVHIATGRITQADRSSTAALTTSTLSAASSTAKHLLALRAGATVTASARPPAPASTPAPPAAPHLLQLTRLHFVAADPVQAAQLASEADVVRSYDIVSIAPRSDKVLHMACASLDVDIICLDLAQRLTLKLRAQAIKAAVRRGVYFEICYSPGLREPTARRNLFCNAQALARVTRGRNLLISSGARVPFEIRSPLEVAAMATLFGLTRQQAQDALRLGPRAVLAHAAARKAGRAAIAATLGGPEAAGGTGPSTAGDVEMGEPEADLAGAVKGPVGTAATTAAATTGLKAAQGGPNSAISGGGRGAGRKRPAGVR